MALAVIALVLMIAVLVPGFGRTVNGSTRWLSIAGVNVIQVSEPARLLMLLYHGRLCGAAQPGTAPVIDGLRPAAGRQRRQPAACCCCSRISAPRSCSW